MKWNRKYELLNLLDEFNQSWLKVSAWYKAQNVKNMSKLYQISRREKVTQMVKKKFHVVFVFRSLTLLKVAVGHQFCPIQVSVAGAQMQLKDLVCNASMLRQFLTVDGGEASMNDLQTQLCNLPADILQEAERLFLSQLDFTKYFTVGKESVNRETCKNTPVHHC